MNKPVLRFGSKGPRVPMDVCGCGRRAETERLTMVRVAHGMVPAWVQVCLECFRKGR